MSRFRALLVIAVMCLPACGYSLAGRGNFLPEYIKVIGVPLFVNHSTMAELDRVLTNAVVAELQSHPRFRIVPDATGVDALMTGTINSLRQDVAAFTANQQAARYAIVGTVSIEFKDIRGNKVLWSNPSASFREEYDVTSSTTANDPAAFLTGDRNALERLAKNFARSVVTAILESF